MFVKQMKTPAVFKALARVDGCFTVLGASYIWRLGMVGKYFVECFNNSEVTDDAKFFTKTIVDGNGFHCINYPRNSRKGEHYA